MKFKVGDKVKVRKDLKVYERYGNMTYVDDMEKMRGKIVTIKEVNGKSYRIKEFNYNWTDEMFEDKTIFTKNDLKDGDIVTYRNGEKRYVDATNQQIVYTYNHHCLSFRFDNFNEDLTDRAGDTEYDIIKVERPAGYTTVFERKEEILDEIEKRYLRDVIRPFRKEICSIKKVGGTTTEHLKIYFKDADYMNFKNFKKDTMYKGMKADKEYTLKKLKL